MPRLQLLVGLLCCLPVAACLHCYTCIFPAISLLDCMKYPTECPVGQRCLSSVATGTKGAIHLTFYERGCAIPSQCGLSGRKYSSGMSFNYTNDCCDTDLCNGAESVGALCRGGAALLRLLPALLMLLLA